MITQKLRLAGWYGWKDRECEVLLSAGHKGVSIQVHIPASSMDVIMDLPYGQKFVPWSEIPEGRDVEEFLRPQVVQLAAETFGGGS